MNQAGGKTFSAQGRGHHEESCLGFAFPNVLLFALTGAGLLSVPQIAHDPPCYRVFVQGITEFSCQLPLIPTLPPNTHT